MSFIHTALLFGLGAIAIPIIIHLLSRKAAKVIDWGAMQFLLDSIESRKRRIQLEEALLMAARCLLMALLALAVARPFAPPGSPIPWVVVLPAFLISLVALTTAIILRSNRRWLWTLLAVAVVAGGYAGLSVYYEYKWNQKKLGTTGKKDIALIIDCSTSMQLKPGSDPRSNFEAAVAEAREIVEKAEGGTAFSVVLGGPVPAARIPEPVVNKASVQEVLRKLQPVRGKMAAFETLATAAVTLSRGSNPNKEIIILTDSQNIGWDTGKHTRWDALGESLGTLTTKPQVLLRKYPLPDSFRNVAIAGISYSRDVIGTDRAVGINVTVENTGTEVVTVQEVELTIPGLKDPLKGTGGQLQPGARAVAQFLHHFKEPGSFVLTAKTNTADGLALDNESVSVCHVVNRLGVLIVDGNPTERFLDRAGSFTALALAPASLMDPSKPKEKKPVALDVEVLPLSRAGSVPSFVNYDVIILADVPKLPAATARRIAGWVEGGGGLLVLPGVQAQPDFYNSWRDAENRSFLPARLMMENIPKEPAGLALSTFDLQPLMMLADAKQSDLGGTLMQRYWRLEPDAASKGSTGGRLANGDPFLTSRRAEFGWVVMACSNFDTASGNLPTRQAFVALVHQLVYYLANPEGQALNRQPGPQVDLPLAQASAEGGLKGEYFKGRSRDEAALVRIDPKPDFQWGNGRPAPSVPENFTARWTGAIVARYSEEYLFTGWGDDALTVTIGGKKIFERGGEGRLKMEAGKFVPIELYFEDNDGGAALQLKWQSASQQSEVVPTECLTPFPPTSTAKAVTVGQWDVIGPDKQLRKAALVFTTSGLVARVDQDIIPGLYQLKVPKEQQKEYAGLASSDGTIPFTVADDVAESRLTALSQSDLDFMHQRLDLLEPKNAGEILNILAGREFGEELWKYLAVGALFILLLEIALTRWIAISRRSGEEVAVSFEDKFEPSAQFKQALRDVQGAEAGGGSNQ